MTYVYMWHDSFIRLTQRRYRSSATISKTQGRRTCILYVLWLWKTLALQCVAVCCSVLQCVVVCCSVLQCDAACWTCFPNHEAVTPVLWVWHDWFIRGTWLIQTCDMTHVYRATFSRTYEAVAQACHAWHDYSSIHEWVMSQIDIYLSHISGRVISWSATLTWKRHVTHMNEPCHVALIRMSHVIPVMWHDSSIRLIPMWHDSWMMYHTHERVMSWSATHTWKSHVTHINGRITYTNESVTHVNESCHIYEWARRVPKTYTLQSKP